jgi:endonuclease/exonuclease/phosphatase family metal-dependent hydrolase
VAATIVTWNVHGSGSFDAEAVAAHLDAVDADLAVLQEVQHDQAAAVADAVGATGRSWCFKHSPPLRPAEGMAVLARDQALEVSCLGLTRRWNRWSWRRRILQLTSIQVDGTPVTLLHTHLTPHPAGGGRRRREARTLVDVLGSRVRTSIVAGDLNEGPDDPALARLTGAGLRDAWTTADERSGAGATNWSGGGVDQPDQRLDYVLCGSALRADRASVPEVDGPGSSWRELSDHLPLTVTISAGGAGSQRSTGS